MNKVTYDLTVVPTTAKERYERGQYILKLANELPEQRTPEWYAERRTCLTASEIHSVLTCRNIDTNIGVKEMIESKKNGQSKQSFNDCQSTRWGEKYEPTSVQIFEKRYGVKIYNVPLLIKGDIGASCDGIVMIEANSNSFPYCTEPDAECIEIKNPFSRTPDGIPKQYMSQMQTQLYVTGLNVCNFFDCKVEEWLDENEFVDDVQCYLNNRTGELQLNDASEVSTLTNEASTLTNEASTLTNEVSTLTNEVSTLTNEVSTDVYGIVAQFVDLCDKRNIRVLTNPDSYYNNTITIDPNENYRVVPLHLYSEIVSADFSDYDKVKTELEERVAQQMQCEGVTFIRYYYWKLVKCNHIRVFREPNWHNNSKDKIALFWDKVVN